MSGRRIDDGAVRGAPFEITVDGVAVEAFSGESLAAVLFAESRRALGRTAKQAALRGYYCGMGVCWDCRVTVNGRSNQRACRTEARPGMRVETGGGGAEGTP